MKATIPDAEVADGRLRELVLDHMVHGPCGADNPYAPCMDHSADSQPKCTKDYPKPLCEDTHIDERGYVHYRRPEGPSATKRNKRTNELYTVTNCDVVPYNPALLLLMECHCNIEIASSVNIIKYLYKYLHKGPDRAKVAIVDDEDKVDEINDHVDTRLISASEADWRTFEYNITEQYLSCTALPIHLPNKDSIIFEEGKEEEALENSVSKLSLYLYRPRDPDLDDLTYLDFYEQYSVTTTRPKKASRKVFELHSGKHFCAKREGEDTVARIHWISPSESELFYLRVLLTRVPAHSYTDLLTHDGIVHNTFQEAARARGLVVDEKEFKEAIIEASTFQTGSGLRQLLVCMVICGAPAKLLWDEFKELFAEDFLDRDPDESRAYNAALCCIDRKLNLHGKSLKEVGLPEASDDTTELGREQRRWDRQELQQFVEHWVPRFTQEQMAVYNCAVDTMEKRIPPKPIFVDGPSGTGKTLLLNVIAAKGRSEGKVVLCASATGISAINYEGGTTAHALLKIPVETTNPNAYCNLTASSQRAKLIEAADVIIWDESPMSHRHNLETVDRTWQDLFAKETFGGKFVILAGDKKQTTPIVRGGGKQDILRVSITSSPLWRTITTFPLTAAQRDREDPDYSQFVLNVGEDKVPKTSVDLGDGKREMIQLDMVQTVDTVNELIDFVYDDLSDVESCAKKAILSGTNANIDDLNNMVLERIPGEAIELLSADSCIMDDNDPDNRFLPTEVLHTINEPGVPQHRLVLKKGCICMVMRNLSFDDALVNGSKVVIRKVSQRLIEADLIHDGYRTKTVLIPRINFVFQPSRSPVKILRRQFPLRVAYCLTFNKSQGQTLDRVGLDLRNDVFSHGQLYVALGRVRNRRSIRVLVSPERMQNGKALAKNIVYKELL